MKPINLPPFWSAFWPYQPTQSQQALGLDNKVPPQIVWIELSTIVCGKRIMILFVSATMINFSGPLIECAL